MTWRWRRRCAPIGMLACVLALVALTITVPFAPRHVAAAPDDDATVFHPVTPCRLIDTRDDASGAVNAGDSIRVAVAGRCGVPENATAAALSVTVTEPSGRGFVTVFPSGTTRPTASNLNFTTDATVANSAVVRLGDGAVDVYVHRTTQVVIDVMGAFTPATDEEHAGRFVSLGPTRLLDTRTSGTRGSGDIVIPLPDGVPADATAVAVNVTIVDAARRGFVSLRPTGTSRTETSIVNADEWTRTRAASAFVPVSAGGFVLYRSMETDVVVDVTGWFTGPSSPSSDDGLFVPEAPRRAWDSRESFDAVHPGGTVAHRLVDSDASAVVANVTAIDTVHPGFVATYPAGTERPGISTLNPRWRLPVANLAVIGNSDFGSAFHSNTGAHLAVDVAGWFTGDPVPVTDFDIPANPPAVVGAHVLVVSDSAWAGMRWLGALGWLRGAPMTADLESCRRLIGQSCRGREGYAPYNGVEAVRRAPAGTKTLVMAAGYNDYSGTFSTAFDQVMAMARAKGISRVVWVMYREDVQYQSPGGASNRETFRTNNVILQSKLASGQFPELELANWRDYSNGHSTWFGSDALHLSATGAVEAAQYVSIKLAALERRACPSDVGGTSTPGGWCADPDPT